MWGLYLDLKPPTTALNNLEETHQTKKQAPRLRERGNQTGGAPIDVTLSISDGIGIDRRNLYPERCTAVVGTQRAS